MNMKIIGRSAVLLSTTLMLLQPLAITTQANQSTASAIDKALRTNNIPADKSGKNKKLLLSFKQWVGPYQNVQEDEDGTYLANFKNGVLPIKVGITGVNVGCVRTSVPLSKASSSIKKIFENCPDLTP
jgi:hypothetical protein